LGFRPNDLSIQKVEKALSFLAFLRDPRPDYDDIVAALLLAVADAYGRDGWTPVDVIAMGNLILFPAEDLRWEGLRQGTLGLLLQAFHAKLETWSTPLPAPVRADGLHQAALHPVMLKQEECDLLQCLVNILIRHTLECQHEVARKLLSQVKFDPEMSPTVMWNTLVLLHSIVDRTCPSPCAILKAIADHLGTAGAAVLEKQDKILLPAGPQMDVLEQVVRARREADVHVRAHSSTNASVRGIEVAADNMTGRSDRKLGEMSPVSPLLSALKTAARGVAPPRRNRPSPRVSPPSTRALWSQKHHFSGDGRHSLAGRFRSGGHCTPLDSPSSKRDPMDRAALTTFHSPWPGHARLRRS
jgi:hypothetical protein